MGKQWKQCQTSFFWAPKSLQMMTAAMKLRRLLLRSKVMANLDSILKSREITLPTKVRLVKAMVFPVVMYRCESWTVKKAEVKSLSRAQLFATPWIACTQLLCPWDFPGKNSGEGFHFLPQGSASAGGFFTTEPPPI